MHFRSQCQILKQISFFQDLHFIRCILPNNDKEKGMFEENLILKQMNTSCTVSFAKFIRFGYSKRIQFQEVFEKCKSVEVKFVEGYFDRSNFYSMLLRCIGFKVQDFKIGNDAIFFRSNKFELLKQFFDTNVKGCFQHEYGPK